MENKEMIAENNTTKPVRSRESLFGTLLLVMLILFTVASIAGVGYVAYTKWHASKQADERPSIASLSMDNADQKDGENNASDDADTATKQEGNETKTSESRASVVAKLKTTAISVLNGGAAKGSAAVVADLLKTAGYTKATPGNATIDYTGMTVYYAAGQEESAQVIKEALVAKYPTIVIKEAVSSNKETATAPITVILGK